MDILQEIAVRTRERIEAQKKAVPLQNVVEAALSSRITGDFPFERALRTGDIAFICEVKRASPSKGVIAADFPYLAIAREYEAAGAEAISVLTEPHYFMGDNRYLREIADAVSIPLLRKDFVVDRYMLYEAKLLGASAVLLIARLLDQESLAEYIGIAHSLGMSALVEAHDEAEIERAVRCGARIIGVNNRNLKTFAVDTSNSIRLRRAAPDSVVFVAESGISSAEDVAALCGHGVNAVLVGEALMRAPNRAQALAALRGNRP